MLVENFVNLMHSIGELIKDAQVAAVKSRTRTRDGECCEWGGGGGARPEIVSVVSGESEGGG